MPRRNAPQNFFSTVRGCPRSCARTNPWFRGQILVRKNQPLVPRSNIAGSWTPGGGGGMKYNPPLSFSAHSPCASCTLGSLRVWQSPTA